MNHWKVSSPYRLRSHVFHNVVNQTTLACTYTISNSKVIEREREVKTGYCLLRRKRKKIHFLQIMILLYERRVDTTLHFYYDIA